MAALASLTAFAVTTQVAAFEREWHLGGGVGAAAVPSYNLGPAFNAYAAYGISDAFDVRAELVTSFHERPAVLASFYGAKLALAYKIDVIQWIPWLAVSGGVLGAGHAKYPFEAIQPTVGAIAGLDYAWTRNFGLGLCVSADYTFRESKVYGAGFLRAEYHFGW